MKDRNKKEFLIFSSILVLLVGTTILISQLFQILGNLKYKPEEIIEFDTQITENEINSEENIVYSSIEQLFADIPEYNSKPYILINDGVSFFTEDDLTQLPDTILLSELGKLGRVGQAVAIVNKSTLATEERTGDMSSITPSGYHQVDIEERFGIRIITPDGTVKHLYERCHEIAYAMCGIETDERILFTGTVYTNQLMLQLVEQPVLRYVKATNDSVLYRVTPHFKDNELVPRGVLMEVYLLNTNGSQLENCVYIYNVQPGLIINYASGDVTRERK